MGIPTLTSTHIHRFKKKIDWSIVLPFPYWIQKGLSKWLPFGRTWKNYSTLQWRFFERLAHVHHQNQDFRRSLSLKGMSSQQIPSQTHQVWLCGDCWDTVCYNWHQLPQASSENLTLAKHILHSSAAHPGDTKWGGRVGGLGGQGKVLGVGGQRRKSWSRMPGAAPKDTMLQQLPHPHRQTKPTKASLQAAAENPIKSSSISNLRHHGKIQTTPSNLESLKVLFLYSFPHTHTLTSPTEKNVRWKIC